MTDELETYDGAQISIVIRQSRCIHSRNCVLDAPSVFVPNVPGAWVHPDNAPPETVMAVALNCPSGAIRYRRNDGGAQEKAPDVNTIRIRENGPLALHAELSIAGDRSSYRATLCRCGASGKKPYCDGSHAQAGFHASGEPATKESPPADKRNGLLEVTPTPNGPLMVVGSGEIVSGTGRTVARIEKTYLCRCGASENKPFCDGSHVKAGFKG
jgi:CDGSH-type Zn-finger protein/uncharacterized Fe-S cluster protein YjdI